MTYDAEQAFILYEINEHHQYKVIVDNPPFMDWRDHIDSDPTVLGGKVRIKGTRIGVAFLLELLGAGWTQEQVLESYPHLTTEDLQAVFAFASETTEEVRLLRPTQPAA